MAPTDRLSSSRLTFSPMRKFSVRSFCGPFQFKDRTIFLKYRHSGMLRAGYGLSPRSIEGSEGALDMDLKHFDH